MRETAKEMEGVHGNRTNAGNAEKTAVDSQSGAQSGALDADLSPVDSDLQAVIDAWPNLPDDVKASILAMVFK